ncbi:hypothetical protein AM499_00915 [Bacillus sp. FJAT-22090]|uniref:hypothetical protein n=1 Tax=Bacillus sp. FJAT-22090 TaxID=1581038 RepID=UPI0006AE42BF|nr:hypothetical protein [Bacillus sp. FJAT-22090]ALC84541.1 hypothetical protein AM499_00915 [Bacillus sp. FJAT-22090]
MDYEEYSYRTGDYLYQIDKEHSCITVYKYYTVIDNIPNNYNREITREQFIKLVLDYSVKYRK